MKIYIRDGEDYYYVEAKRRFVWTKKRKRKWIQKTIGLLIILLAILAYFLTREGAAVFCLGILGFVCMISTDDILQY